MVLDAASPGVRVPPPQRRESLRPSKALGGGRAEAACHYMVGEASLAVMELLRARAGRSTRMQVRPLWAFALDRVELTPSWSAKALFKS